jgi:TorA maturation chaperone TorD
MAYETTERPDSEQRGEFDSEVAAVFAVLSECWKRPTQSVVTTVNEDELGGIFPDVDDVSLEDIRTEYTRLLLGPGPEQIPAYESVYRDRDEDESFGPVRGASTQAVRKWYLSYGVTPAEDQSELPDHIAIELEFAAYLAENEDLETCEQFLDEHLRQWATEFLSAIHEETDTPFYESLAAATETAIYMDVNER